MSADAVRFRRVTRAEESLAGCTDFDTLMLGRLLIPDIRPLGRAATADDVKAGRAVFALGGKGEPLALRLPAVAELKDERGLVVQAETQGGSRPTAESSATPSAASRPPRPCDSLPCPVADAQLAHPAPPTRTWAILPLRFRS